MACTQKGVPGGNIIAGKLLHSGVRGQIPITILIATIKSLYTKGVPGAILIGAITPLLGHG